MKPRLAEDGRPKKRLSSLCCSAVQFLGWCSCACHESRLYVGRLNCNYRFCSLKCLLRWPYLDSRKACAEEETRGSDWQHCHRCGAGRKCDSCSWSGNLTRFLMFHDLNGVYFFFKLWLAILTRISSRIALSSCSTMVSGR